MNTQTRERIFWVGLAVVSIFLAVSIASAESAATAPAGAPDTVSSDQKNEAGDRELRRQRKGDWFAGKLGLTDQQKEQLKALRTTEREKTKAVRETLRAKRIELRTELEKPETDAAAFSKIASEIKALEAQLFDLRTEEMLQVKQIFTPEQREKMKQLREEHEKKKDANDGMRGSWRERIGQRMKGMKERGDFESSEDALGGPLEDDMFARGRGRGKNKASGCPCSVMQPPPPPAPCVCQCECGQGSARDGGDKDMRAPDADDDMPPPPFEDDDMSREPEL